MADLSWRDWNESVFEDAKASNRPVLLYLKVSWCRFCRELENAVFDDPEIVAAIERSYVPVCVDKEEFPQVDERYNQGGWPTLAVLTAGGEVITGGSDLTLDEARGLIDGAAQHYKEHEDEVGFDFHELFPEPDATKEVTHEIVDHVGRAILDAFDRRHGGFGNGQKFPHPESLDFAILYYAKTRNPAFQELVQKTLTAMTEGRLFDPVSGAFFRYCATRDWRQPHTEILLDTQTGFLRNYLEGYQLFGRDDFRVTATKVLSYLEHTLRDPETGAYFGSQDADDVYYTLDEIQRRDRKAPPTESSVYSNSLASTVSSLLKAGSVLQDEAVRERGRTALHFLLENMYLPGRGMYHSWDGSPHILGLLTDQIHVARALVHAVQYTGDNQYLPILEDLLQTIRKKESANHGGFYDISEDDLQFTQTRRRNTTLLENGIMAEVLVRASCLLAEPEYHDLAGRTLQAFASHYQLSGYHTAPYARAVELYCHSPLQVFVVGAKGNEARERMLQLAQATYVPSKVILAIDPETEGELLQRHGFPASDAPVAYLCREHAGIAEVTDPDQLVGRMQASVG